MGTTHYTNSRSNRGGFCTFEMGTCEHCGGPVLKSLLDRVFEPETELIRKGLKRVNAVPPSTRREDSSKCDDCAIYDTIHFSINGRAFEIVGLMNGTMVRH